jgi:hypothetical protein
MGNTGFVGRKEIEILNLFSEKNNFVCDYYIENSHL